MSYSRQWNLLVPFMHCSEGMQIVLKNVDSSWNVMAHVDLREGKWRGNWRMEWVASTLHTISEHGVSSITTADGHTSTASSGLIWSPRRFKWSRPFRRKTKSGFCACALTFQMTCNSLHELKWLLTETAETDATTVTHWVVLQLILFINSMSAVMNGVIVCFVLVTILVCGSKTCIYNTPGLTVKH